MIKNIDKTWIASEQAYWDKFYAKKNIPSQIIPLESIAGNRLYPVDKYLFSFLRPIISGKRILDVGCGDAYIVGQLANPTKYQYSLFGIDISQEALKIARRSVRGKFILCSVEEHPFKEKSFDIILCFGILHHTKKKEKLLTYLSKLLKKNGVIALCEPLERPGLLGKIFRRLLFFIPESEHEERINEKNFWIEQNK